MEDWRSFIKIYAFIMAVTLIVAAINSETLLLTFGFIVLVLVVLLAIFGGGGGGDGGVDGKNY